MRLIDADAFKARINLNDKILQQILRRIVDDQPTAFFIVHRHWVTSSDYPDTVICSGCGQKEDVWWADKGTSYCPNCGARMDGDAE